MVWRLLRQFDDFLPMKRYFLFCWVMAVLPMAAWGQASITSLAVVNHGAEGGTSNLINADGLDSDVVNGATNRHYIRAEAVVNFTSAGSYIVVFELLDPSDVVKATITNSLGSVTLGSQTVQADIPAPTTQLDLLALHRVRARVRLNNGLPPPSGPYVTVDTETEATGRQYRHFHSVASTDAALHVIGTVNAVTMTGNRSVVDGVSGQQSFPVDVDFTIRRYDEWAAFSASSALVAVTVEYTLRRSDGAAMTLEDADEVFLVNVPTWQLVLGVKSPSVTTFSRQVQLNPAVQLDCINYTYTAEARITHVDEPGVTLASAVVPGAVEHLGHFNGTVRFGTTGVSATLTGLSAVPSKVNVISSESWNLPIAVAGAVLVGFPEHTLGGDTLAVTLEPGGDAVYSSAGSYGVTGPAEDTGTQAGIDFRRQGISLSGTAITATVTATLPGGTGVAYDAAETVMGRTLSQSAAQLNASLVPTDTISFSGGPYFIHEETKPLIVECSSIQWDTAMAVFTLVSPTPHPTRKPFLDALNVAMGQPAGTQLKASNDHYWNAVTGLSGALIARQADGSGALSITATLGSGSMKAHFPETNTFSFTGGTVVLVNDVPNVATSVIGGVATVGVNYVRHCLDTLGSCATAQTSTGTYSIAPTDGQLKLTAHGGLHAAGTTYGSHRLQWGRLSGGTPTYAHEVVAAFTNANFLTSGTFVASSAGAAGAGGGVVVLPLTGFNAGALQNPILPGTTPYLTGFGDYAGANLRATGDDAGRQMQSRLAGAQTVPYALTTNSKFYVRASGVSGVQQAAGPVTPSGMGTPAFGMALSTLGLSWLSNDNQISRTEGSLVVPYPADFTLDFADLRFTCLGAPTDARIQTASVSKRLRYWNAPFRALGLTFVQNDACDPADVTLTVSSQLRAQNMDLPLTGTLGYHPTGQIVAPADGVRGVTSEIALPPELEILGPKRGTEERENYTFTPVRPAYLNTESEGTAGVGFWNLVGLLNVPFFEDLRVHAHTGADPTVADAGLHMTGGFSTGSGTTAKTFFNDALFDAGHRGTPAGMTVGAYRPSAAHRPVAYQQWRRLIEFEYPLEWNSARRTFRSSEPVEKSLQIVTASHQVTYLSGKQVYLDFGAQYEGLPRINVANVVFNALEDQTGAAQSVVEALGEDVFAAVEGGVEGLTDLLSDQVDRLMGEVVAEVVDPGLNVFFDEVKRGVVAAINDGGDVTTNLRANLKATVDAYLRPSGSAPPPPGDEAFSPPPSFTPSVPSMGGALGGFVGTLPTVDYPNIDPPSPPTGLLASVHSSLGAVQKSVYGMAGDVGDVNNPLAGVGPGLLGLDQWNGRSHLLSVAQNLVADFATPDLSALYAQAPTFDFLNEAQAGLDEIQASLQAVRRAVADLQEQLKGALGLAGEFRILQGNLDSELNLPTPDGIMNQLADAVQAELDRALDRLEENLPSAAGAEAYVESLRAELKERIVREVRDRFLALDPIQDMRQVLRQRLQGVQMAWREGVDAAFEEVNQIIRRALSEALASLDETLSGATDGITSVLKAGRVSGHAHIMEDALRKLRLEALLELDLAAAPLRFDGFIEYEQLDLVGPGGCPSDSPSPANAGQVTVGMRDAPLEWLSPGLRGDVTASVGFYDAGQVLPVPFSVGGSFTMRGEMEMEIGTVRDVYGAVKIGAAPAEDNMLVVGENYVALNGEVEVSSAALDGGIFLGSTCELDPILGINPLLGNALGAAPFRGIYLFGGGRIPVVDFGCVFNLSAGAGLGFFVFADGPTFGAAARLSCSGEALCSITARGDVDLVGGYDGTGAFLSGVGRIRGKAGICDFCLRFDESVSFSYRRGEWDADF